MKNIRISKKVVLNNSIYEETARQNISSTDTSNSSLPSLKSVPGLAMTRTASIYTGDTGNVTVAPPGFYSPYHTPLAWQIPTVRHEVYRWCSYWLHNEPRIAIAIDFYSEFPCNGFTLECHNAAIRSYFEDLCVKLNVDYWLPKILREYYAMGDAFVVLTLDCEHCQGTGFTEEGEECSHEGATWKNISILDPITVEVLPYTAWSGEEPHIYVRPNEELRRIVATGNPKEIYERIPDDIKILVRKNAPIKLNPLVVTHFKHGCSAYQTYGVSIIRRLFPTLVYKDKLRQAQALIADRHILPIKLVRVGNDTYRATEEDIARVEAKILEASNNPLITIVSHHAIEFEWIGSSGRILQLTNEFELIENEMVDGLGLTRSILTGEGPTYANAQVAIEVIAKRLESVRTMLANWLEEKVFKPVAKFNGFYDKNERGEDDLIYPKVKWNELRLRDNAPKMQYMWEAVKQGAVSYRTFVEQALGLDFDNEIENIRLEETMSLLASSKMASQIGTLGGGYGGGVMPSAPPGMPPLGGGGLPGVPGAPGIPGATMPGGIGTPPGGAMPGGAGPEINMPPGGAEGMGGLPIFSETDKDKFMKRVADTNEDMKRIVNSSNGLGTGYRGHIKDEDIHELVNNIENVDSSTFAEEYESNYRNIGEAVVSKYIKDAKKKDDDAPVRRVMLTKPEAMLAQAILNQNYPYPVYTQYVINNDYRYRVDFAFPTLQIAIEADGRTWHASPDSINRDKQRDMILASQGWIVLRFTEEEIYERIDDVISVINQAINYRLQQKQPAI